jgi:hypothetical protein
MVVMRVSASSSNLTVQEGHLDGGDPAIIYLMPLSDVSKMLALGKTEILSDDDVGDPEHGVGPYT